ncbi:hypothetical protein, partial [Streptomyces sp. WELS2]|uniref:hypothetical protein n=1 Tax=Streptomyces sp. WELS2 TaxID=2749435 RepID=UPI001C68EC9C
GTMRPSTTPNVNGGADRDQTHGSRGGHRGVRGSRVGKTAAARVNTAPRTVVVTWSEPVWSSRSPCGAGVCRPREAV